MTNMKKRFRGETDYQHGEIPAFGVLLTNLGTPAAPTAAALRPYLKQFLSDPRVIDLPRWKWYPILYLFVLTRRPAKSAEAYEQIWTDDGSPLLVYSRKQAEGLEQTLRSRFGGPIHVALGMRYGEPSIENALRELEAKSCRRIIHLPLYPQYSATTTASNVDEFHDCLRKRKWIPEFRNVMSYTDNPGYIEALVASIREHWEEHGRGKKLLFSFHGIPQRYYDDGDFYPCQCQKTARLVTEALGLSPDDYKVCFQSRFGREPWIQPYTDKTLEAWGNEKLETVDVICPGFSADCVETLEEIAMENREIFEEAGGGTLRYIPALNDRPDHIETLADVVAREAAGWLTPKAEYDSEAIAQCAHARAKLAEKLRSS